MRCKFGYVKGFLSTLSLRRATRGGVPCYLDNIISIHALLAESDCIIDIINNVINNFYPRSPCGERRYYCSCTVHNHRFLSTLSLRRATTRERASIKPIFDFYPRSPCGERLVNSAGDFALKQFLSTLSLRRATQEALTQTGPHIRFLSTLSLRRATQALSVTGSESQFLSTLSLRRATLRVAVLQHAIMISIHALLAESDGTPISAIPVGW